MYLCLLVGDYFACITFLPLQVTSGWGSVLAANHRTPSVSPEITFNAGPEVSCSLHALPPPPQKKRPDSASHHSAHTPLSVTGSFSSGPITTQRKPFAARW